MITVAEPIDADTLRTRHEFLTRREWCASADGVAELLGLPLRHAVTILESLVREGLLGRTADGRYVRVSSAGRAGSQ
jgi:predicted transcriptional regulator of viral defense system